MNRYKYLRDVLDATDIPFTDYAWATAPAGKWYGTVSLDGAGDTVAGDGEIVEQALEGSIDLFVRGSGWEGLRKVQQALNRAPGVAWRLESVQYEPDTGLVHYEWVFQLEGM